MQQNQQNQQIPNNTNQRKTALTTTKVESDIHMNKESSSIKPETLFPTAIITVRSEGGIVYKLRALLDQCSDDEAFIKESTAEMLRLKQVQIPPFEVVGMDDVVTAKINKALKFEMVIDQKNSLEIEASIVKNLVGMLPRTEVKWPKDLFKNLKLADPNFATPNNIDVMLGGKTYAELLLERILKEGGYLAQNTKLGWIISGQCDQQSRQPKQKATCLHNRIVQSPQESNETDNILMKFWEMEEMPRKQRKRNQEEFDCEQSFKQSYRRLDDGRVQVKLPFKEKPNEVLGESRSQAVAR